jgi:hypothetical protein
VAELADTPGAVPVLVALHDSDGSATLEVLVHEVGPECGEAVRWLIGVGLIRAIIDGHDGDRQSFRLTDVGAALIRSLNDLAHALADDTGLPQNLGA